MFVRKNYATNSVQTIICKYILRISQPVDLWVHNFNEIKYESHWNSSANLSDYDCR